jgi:hypothetical protein
MAFDISPVKLAKTSDHGGTNTSAAATPKAQLAVQDAANNAVDTVVKTHQTEIAAKTSAETKGVVC